MTRFGCAFLALAAFSLPFAHAGGGKTPEEAFAGLAEAAKKEDMKALLSHLTTDSQKVMTGSMLFSTVGLKQFAELSKKFGKEIDVKPVDALIEKYRINEGELIETMKKLESLKDPKDAVKIMVKLAATVKDPPAFIADAINALKAAGQDKGNPADILKKAKLGEVKIDGEKARGKIESEGKAQPIFFAREGGVWKVDILPAIFEPPPVEEKKGKSEK